MENSPSLLEKFIPRRIWLQMFGILTLLVMVPLIILGFLLITTSHKALKTSVLRDQKQIAIHTTGEVKEYIQGPTQALHVTASILGTLQSDTWRQETSIVELALRYPIFERISSINMAGQEIATSELGTELQDRKREIAFQEAKKGKMFVSEVSISKTHEPILSMSTPINELGRITGVLMARVNLRGVWDIVDSIKIGETGRAFLVDQRGRLLSHPDKKLVLKNENPLNTAIIKDVLNGGVGSLEEFDEDKKQWLYSYAPIKTMNWGLVIAQSTKEAYAFSSLMQTQSRILITISVIITIFISFLLSRLISRPINNLIKATKHVSKGDFDYRLETTRRDEIGNLLQSFNTMTNKLKDAQRLEKLSTIGKAATAIAHELKNSLVLVKTFIGLLPERHKDKEFIEEFSKTVPQEIDSWKQMLQDMTNYSRIHQLKMKDTDINSLIQEVGQLAKQRASQEEVNLVVAMNENLPHISGNAEKLKQVFLNLLNNALQSTPKGGSVSVHTDFGEESDMWKSRTVKIQIDDSGSGIPKDRLDKIFDPFYTTKEDGLGLGLAISKEIVDYHGGSIEAFNRKDSGASFKVTIPIRK